MKTLQTNLLFLLKDKQILLAMKKRGFAKGRWNGVGGKVEPGETVEEAVIRECQEEIGVTPHDLKKVAIHTFINKDKDNKPYTITVHAYTCTSWAGEPTETDEMAPQWFAQDKIPYKTMWPDDIHWLPLVLEGKRVVSHFEFDQKDNVLNYTVKVVKSLDIPGLDIAT